MQAVEPSICLPLASRLERWIGARLALIVALVVAGFRLRKTTCAPDLKRLIYVLVAATTATAGFAAATADPEQVRRDTTVLHRLSTLKSADVVRMLAEFNEAMMLNVEGKSQAAQAKLEKLIAGLEAPGALPSMTATSRSHYLAGALGIHAAHDVTEHNARCLASADKMDKFGGVHSVWANQVRAIYYANMGQAGRAAHFRRQVELGAIQLGSAWQVETWPAPALLTSYADDAASFKRMADEMERLGSVVPTFRVFARWNRAAYLVCRGRHEEALALYQGQAEPTNLVGDIPACAWFATAMNAVGAHERARACCIAALARVTPEDRPRISHTLRLEVELAIADAGLGQHEQAQARLSGLFARHTPHTGPLVLGYLHCARARLWLMAGDMASYQVAVAAAAQLYAPLDLPSLHERIAAMRRVASEPSETTTSAGNVVDSHLLTRVQLRLESVTASNETARHDVALQVALELAHAETGFIVRSTGKCVAPPGTRLIPELVQWAETQLSSVLEEDATALVGPPANDQSGAEADTVEHAGVAYRVQILWSSAGEPIAALVLGSTRAKPSLLSHQLLGVLTNYLKPTRSNASNSGAA